MIRPESVPGNIFFQALDGLGAGGLDFENVVRNELARELRNVSAGGEDGAEDEGGKGIVGAEEGDSKAGDEGDDDDNSDEGEDISEDVIVAIAVDSEDNEGEDVEKMVDKAVVLKEMTLKYSSISCHSFPSSIISVWEQEVVRSLDDIFRNCFVK